MDNNAYLLRCTNTGDQLLIDAANEPQTLLGLLGGEPLGTIVTTHQHGDHTAALEEVASQTKAETVAHLEDAPALPVAPSLLVGHGDDVYFGKLGPRAQAAMALPTKVCFWRLFRSSPLRGPRRRTLCSRAIMASGAAMCARFSPRTPIRRPYNHVHNLSEGAARP